jgi:hypothetical protein
MQHADADMQQSKTEYPDKVTQLGIAQAQRSRGSHVKDPSAALLKETLFVGSD